MVEFSGPTTNELMTVPGFAPSGTTISGNSFCRCGEGIRGSKSRRCSLVCADLAGIPPSIAVSWSSISSGALISAFATRIVPSKPSIFLYYFLRKRATFIDSEIATSALQFVVHFCTQICVLVRSRQTNYCRANRRVLNYSTHFGNHKSSSYFRKSNDRFVLQELRSIVIHIENCHVDRGSGHFTISLSIFPSDYVKHETGLLLSVRIEDYQLSIF